MNGKTRLTIALTAIFSLMFGTMAPAIAENPDSAASSSTKTTSDSTSDAAPSSEPPSVEIFVKAATTVSVRAEATAAAAGSVTVNADTIIIQEERTRSPHKAIRDFKPPTLTKARQKAVRVNSTQHAQNTAVNLVAKYDNKVMAAKKAITKIQQKLKLAKTKKFRNYLKRQLKAKQRFLASVRTSYDHIPIMEVPDGVCVLNSGRYDNLELQPFRYCGSPGVRTIYVVYIPAIREFVIAIVVMHDGRVLIGCFNITGFQIPPGTPDSILVLVVRSLLALYLNIQGRLYLATRLTIGGRLRCPDGTIVEDEETEVFEGSEAFSKTVRDYDVKRAIRVTEGDARVDMSLQASIKDSIVASHTEELSKSLTLECDNQPPTGEIVQGPDHIYTNNPNDPASKPGEFRVKVVGSDPEDGADVDLNVTLTGPIEFVVDAEHPVHEDVEGTNLVRYFWIRAKRNQTGNASIRLVVTDTDGNSSPPATKSFPVLPDEF